MIGMSQEKFARQVQGEPKKQNALSLTKIFTFNYSSFLSQVAVGDLVHELLQQ